MPGPQSYASEILIMIWDQTCASVYLETSLAPIEKDWLRKCAEVSAKQLDGEITNMPLPLPYQI